MTATHFMIPDCQVKPGVKTDHLGWIGQYIVDHAADQDDVTIIQIGDFHDMPSLSSYDRGKKASEGRRYSDDIEAGNDAFVLLNAAMDKHNLSKRRRNLPEWNPRKVITLGNHEDRITRAANDAAFLDGTVTLTDLDYRDWDVVPFLEPIVIDGIAYAHYFYNPGNGRPLAGMIETKIKTLGRSFTQGHQQVLQYGVRPAWDSRGKPTMQHGLVAGACYLHDEDYMGPQGNAYWRGIVVCHEVRDGTYDPMFLSLDYLCRRYEGVPLEKFAPGLGNGRRAA